MSLSGAWYLGLGAFLFSIGAVVLARRPRLVAAAEREEAAADAASEDHAEVTP